MSTLPASVTFQFETAAATVQWENGPLRQRLAVQCIDQYGFQREWTLTELPEGWESHAYQHPGRREIISGIGSPLATKAINRFLELCSTFPALLFNEAGDHATNKARPRSEGFVRFFERIGPFGLKEAIDGI